MSRPISVFHNNECASYAEPFQEIRAFVDIPWPSKVRLLLTFLKSILELDFIPCETERKAVLNGFLIGRMPRLSECGGRVVTLFPAEEQY